MFTQLLLDQIQLIYARLGYVHNSFYQMTPLHLAAESGRIKKLKHLIGDLADVNIQNENGVSSYMYQCY